MACPGTAEEEDNSVVWWQRGLRFLGLLGTKGKRTEDQAVPATEGSLGARDDHGNKDNLPPAFDEFGYMPHGKKECGCPE